MYSCNLICNGNVERGELLQVKTLSQAIANAHFILNSGRFEFRGLEIWNDDDLVYIFGEMASE